MVKVVRSTIVDASAVELWSVLRDFNGHDRWHPAVKSSQIERVKAVGAGLHDGASDVVGCVRRFVLQDGSELREQLLAMSDLEMSYSYCLLDTPIPLINYVSHVSLTSVTDGNRAFWRWESTFSTPAGEESRLEQLVANEIYQAGFDAIKHKLGLDRSGA